jgi:PAS domain S-box-containing protein
MMLDDVTRATEEALHEREITFAALAKVAPVGIMRFDANGRCNYTNDRWRQMAGMSIDAAIGDGWTKAIHPEDLAAVLQRWAQMRTRDEGFREEYRLCRSDGTVTWVFAEGAPLRSYSGAELGFIRAVTDITRHRQLEAELTNARAELEERVRERTADLQTEMAERQKLEKQVLELKDSEQTRFSQDLHDGLGQYLTGILFRAVALHRSLESERSPHTGSALKISELVEEAINQAYRLARGIAPVPSRPDGLVAALEELVKTMCESEMANCIFECEEPVYVEDNTMATHVYRIAQEAITNAMKHGKASRVVVRIQRLTDACELSVRDDGKGFPARVSARRGRGLNIMKHRARLINGDIQVHPARPHGTAIICRFPLPAKR